MKLTESWRRTHIHPETLFPQLWAFRGCRECKLNISHCVISELSFALCFSHPLFYFSSCSSRGCRSWHLKAEGCGRQPNCAAQPICTISSLSRALRRLLPDFSTDSIFRSPPPTPHPLIFSVGGSACIQDAFLILVFTLYSSQRASKSQSTVRRCQTQE